MAARLIETYDLLVDDAAREAWDALDHTDQNALLFWVNAPRSERARRGRQRKAIEALHLGTAKLSADGGLSAGRFLDFLDRFFSPHG